MGGRVRELPSPTFWTTWRDLPSAFLSGYGRLLDDADHAILHGCAVLTAVWMLVKAHEAPPAIFRRQEPNSLAAPYRQPPLILCGCSADLMPSSRRPGHALASPSPRGARSACRQAVLARRSCRWR
jgi:hypothetical protein